MNIHINRYNHSYILQQLTLTVIINIYSYNKGVMEIKDSKNTVKLVIYCFDDYWSNLHHVLESFEGIIEKYIIMFYDFGNVTKLKKYDNKITYIPLKHYDNNINKCINSIIGLSNNSDVWVFWKPYFIFDINMTVKFNKIINLITNNKMDASYIYGINLYFDIYHIKANNPYSCKKGGCFLSNNNIILKNDSEPYLFEKGNLRINYALKDTDNKYFYNFAKSVQNSYMILETFELNYISFIRNKEYISFADYYQNLKNIKLIHGQKYIEKKLLSDNDDVIKFKYENEIPKVLLSIDSYDYDNKIRTYKLHDKYHDFSMTIVTLCRNNKQYLKQSMGSLIRQTSDKWNCIIINDGSKYDISFDDFLTEENIYFKNRFTIINLKEWNGLIKCHKLATMHATNDIIGILDTDDMLEHNAIAEVLDLYNKTKNDNVFVYTNFMYCDNNMIPICMGYSNNVETCLLNDRAANHFRTFKLKYYYLTKGYDPDLVFGAEDQDILFKMETICYPIFLDKALYLYRKSQDNLHSISSLRILSKHSLYVSLFKNIIDRYGKLNFVLTIYPITNNEDKKQYINTRNIQNYNNVGITINNNIFYADISSNDIYLLDASTMAGIDHIIPKMDKKIMDVNINWNYLTNEFILLDKSEECLDIEKFKKVHPSLYFDNIYIINLKKDTNKRERMEKIFNNLGIKHEFFDAVYGKDELYYNQYLKQKYEDTLRSPGAYGYTLTMINIFNDCLKNKYKKILVCDDDLIFCDNFLNLFDLYIREIPFDWMVLFLGLSGPWTHPFVNKDFVNYNFNKKYITDLFNCDGSYCVGYDILIIEELMNIINKFTHPFDTAIIKHLNSNQHIDKYAFYPYLVIADTTNSDICTRNQDVFINYTQNQFNYKINMANYQLCSVLNSSYDKLYFDPYPLVSVIMTVYNKSKYLDDSIKSILGQTYRKIELIIIDDKSTDHSASILKKYEDLPNVKILYNQCNYGCYKSRNIAIKASSGTIIGFQDADDYSLKTRIGEQITVMYQNKLLMCGCNMIRSHIPDIHYESDDEILQAVNNALVHKNKNCCSEIFGYPTLLIQRELFYKYGYYIERRKGMDMEFPERILFYETKYLFNTSSWEFFDKENNNIYRKIDKLLVISPEMNDSNITNQIPDDSYLEKKMWRLEYKKIVEN